MWGLCSAGVAECEGCGFGGLSIVGVAVCGRYGVLGLQSEGITEFGGCKVW